MGYGTEFRCNRCGNTYAALSGIGFCFPEEYRETVKKIRNGEFGKTWKQLFDSIPGAAVNVERELYVCPNCGTFAIEPNLTIYEMKKPISSKPENSRRSVSHPPSGEEYVVPYELRQDYRLVKSYSHNCPECGRRMHKYRPDDRMKCPECKEGQMEPSGALMWD